MERELLLTGIGGQGVQLAAQTVARAATHEGRSTMLFGIYSGIMRGGNTESSVVVAEGPIEAPPIVTHAWSAIVMHHKFWEPTIPKLRKAGVVMVNSTLFEGRVDRDTFRVFDVPATEISIGLGNELASSMVMVGAYVGVTGLVDLGSAIEGMRQSLPPYRRQHIDGNEAALGAGYDVVDKLIAPAWPEPPRAGSRQEDGARRAAADTPGTGL